MSDTSPQVDYRWLVVQAAEHPSRLDALSYPGVERAVTYYNGKHQRTVIILRVDGQGLTAQRLDRLAQDQADRLSSSLAGVEVTASFSSAIDAWSAWVEHHEASFLKRQGAQRGNQ